MLLCVRGFAAEHAGHHGTAPAVLDLDELVKEALEANPDILASQKKREALWERPPQAKSWEDPRLEFGVRNVPADDADFSKIDMTMKEVALSQAIPFPGITSLREKIAIQEAKNADRMHEYTRLQITREVKKAYYRAVSGQPPYRHGGKEQGPAQPIRRYRPGKICRRQGRCSRMC